MVPFGPLPVFSNLEDKHSFAEQLSDLRKLTENLNQPYLSLFLPRSTETCCICIQVPNGSKKKEYNSLLHALTFILH